MAHPSEEAFLFLRNIDLAIKAVVNGNAATKVQLAGKMHSKPFVIMVKQITEEELKGFDGATMLIGEE